MRSPPATVSVSSSFRSFHFLADLVPNVANTIPIMIPINRVIPSNAALGIEIVAKSIFVSTTSVFCTITTNTTNRDRNVPYMRSFSHKRYL